jgi:hypothetical protein
MTRFPKHNLLFTEHLVKFKRFRVFTLPLYLCRKRRTCRSSVLSAHIVAFLRHGVLLEIREPYQCVHGHPAASNLQRRRY